MIPKAKVKGEMGQEAQTTLNIVRMCERFNTLPDAGGLFQQDSLFVYLLYNIMLFEGERSELDQAKAKHQANIKS